MHATAQARSTFSVSFRPFFFPLSFTLFQSIHLSLSLSTIHYLFSSGPPHRSPGDVLHRERAFARIHRIEISPEGKLMKVRRESVRVANARRFPLTL